MRRFAFLELAIIAVILANPVLRCTSNEAAPTPATAGEPRQTEVGKDSRMCSITTGKSTFLVPNRSTNDCLFRLTISVPRAPESVDKRCNVGTKPMFSEVKIGNVELTFGFPTAESTYNGTSKVDTITGCVIVKNLRYQNQTSTKSSESLEMIYNPKYVRSDCVPASRLPCANQVMLVLDRPPEVSFNLSIVGVDANSTSNSNSNSKSGARSERKTRSATTTKVNVCCGVCGGIEEVGLGLGTLRRSGDRAAIEVTAVDPDDEVLEGSDATRNVNLTTEVLIRVASASSFAATDESNTLGNTTSKTSRPESKSDSGPGTEAGGSEAEKAESRQKQKQEQDNNVKIPEAVSRAIKVFSVSSGKQRVEIERDELCSAVGKSMGRGSSRVGAQQRQPDFGDGNGNESRSRWNEDGVFCFGLEFEIEATATSRQLDFDEQNTTSKWVQMFWVGSGVGIETHGNRTREDEAAAGREDGEAKRKRKRGEWFCGRESRGCRGETCAGSSTTRASDDSIDAGQNNYLLVLLVCVATLLFAIVLGNRYCSYPYFRVKRCGRRYDSNNHNLNRKVKTQQTSDEEAELN